MSHRASRLLPIVDSSTACCNSCRILLLRTPRSVSCLPVILILGVSGTQRCVLILLIGGVLAHQEVLCGGVGGWGVGCYGVGEGGGILRYVSLMVKLIHFLSIWSHF